jgi:hypothetical protein
MYSLVTPYMIKDLKWGTFLFYAGLDLCNALFVWTCLKEVRESTQLCTLQFTWRDTDIQQTCGKSIEEMEEIFNSKAGRHHSITHNMIEGLEDEEVPQKPSTQHFEDSKM